MDVAMMTSAWNRGWFPPDDCSNGGSDYDCSRADGGNDCIKGDSDDDFS
jgi:hypothetical protein